ncbi:LPS-assembly protein LptD [Chitinolyticbacter albus]|uniref:LPS-assembly protein LptD n=1 Tax=Chitinolyticbacter albus TaxID=2961951 RepID=UPI00210985AE|nr:LPS-assembly protein LptD [Chitinolyticbacter albus]
MIALPPLRLSALTLALLAAHLHAEEAEQPPIQVEADQVQGHAQHGAEAQGNVIITQEETEVRADWAKYDVATDHVTAGDHVEMRREGDLLTGRSLDYFLQARRGTLTDPDYQIAQGLGRGDAVSLLFDGPDRYQLDQGRFTTCPVDNDDWYIHASTLSLDYASNTGMAQNGWVEFYGMPILYSPWMNFPLSGNRQTGFLVPTISLDSRNGLDLTTPFYWNIAPNYDATLYPRYLAKRGVMLGGEIRYLQPSYAGVLRGDYLNDNETHESRYGLLFQHRHQITDRLSLSVNAQKVSDDDYFNDFGNQAEIASIDNLPREATFNYTGDGWYGYARWQRFQTIQNSDHTVEVPYARLPQLYFGTAPAWIPGAKININAEYADFRHPTKTEGERAWVYPTIAYPIQNAYSFLIPKVGVHATQYQLDETSDTETESRVVPLFSLDSGLVFERDDTFRGLAYTQTLEPRAYYVYVPYRDQSMLPNFDSGQTDFSLAQIFTENQFSGNDRINDANQLTLAVTSRFYESETGIERFYATLAQRFYFTEQRVTLSSPGRPADVTKSDMLVSVGGQIWRNFTASYSLQYNWQDTRSGRSEVSLSWQPGEARVLNARYLMNRVTDDTEQIDASFQWPLGAGWYGVGRMNYSLKDNQSLDSLLGAEYNAGCWGLRLAVQRYLTSGDRYNTTYFAMLQLGALGGLGSNPLGTLRNIIPGYTDPYPPAQ